MNKKTKIKLATLSLVLSSITTLVGSAHAGNSAFCTSARVCVYEDSGFSKGMGWRSAGFALQNVTLANNDKMSSWENRTGTYARWYVDISGGGACHPMAPYSEVANLYFWENDTMSSWAGDGTC
jgi:hypothetical protein